MSTTGITPVNYTPKSFWKKPEGKPGMLLTAGIVIGGLYLFWLLLPFLLGVVWGAVNLAIGLIVLGSIAYIVTNKTVQNVVKNIFQSICRGVAMIYTTIDPIGILQNQLDDMKKAKKELEDTVRRFSGSDNNLKSIIDGKKQEIRMLQAKIQQAEQFISTSKDPVQRDKYSLKRQTMLDQSGLLMQGVQQLQNLETQTAGMLEKFRKWSDISDAKIERTQNRVEFYSAQRKAILDAQRTLNVGLRILKGDPEQLKLVDGAIEFLTEETARTLGEIEDFNRDSDKMLLDINLENGANAEVARQRFAEFSSKLDESASLPSAIDQLQLPEQTITPTVTGVREIPANASNYSDMFSNKK